MWEFLIKDSGVGGQERLPASGETESNDKGSVLPGELSVHTGSVVRSQGAVCRMGRWQESGTQLGA